MVKPMYLSETKKKFNIKLMGHRFLARMCGLDLIQFDLKQKSMKINLTLCVSTFSHLSLQVFIVWGVLFAHYFSTTTILNT